MDFAKKQLLLVYLDSKGAYFYSENTGMVLQLDFPPDVVSESDIVNRERFKQIVNSFVQANYKGQSYSVVLIFSKNISFEKEIIPSLGKEIEDLVQEFVSVVPFEEVLSKTYKLNKKTIVVGVNKELFDILRNIFDLNKMQISSILPMSIIQEENPELADRIDLSFISQKVDSYKQFNMIEYSQSEFPQEQTKNRNLLGKNRRLLGLVGIFAFLFLALIVFAYINLFNQQTVSDEEDLIKAFTPTPFPKNQTEQEVGSPSATPTL